MIHFQEKCVRIHWDPEIAAVWAEWLSYAEGREFRDALDAGIELLAEKKAFRWLADTTLFGPVTPEDQTWTLEDWFPRAFKAGVRYMAFVMPRKVVAQMSVKRVMNKIDGQDLVTTYFDTREEARAWLRVQK